ncbi:hypothetical protein [Minwuia thermotolerans]|uniref:hypothetical protein n=1 Tax=Minwuia thermotolerans TaxID=2056226 RepID=UPI0013DDE1E3|nr:hypothetical protein [Minwuia thermotolerans]
MSRRFGSTSDDPRRDRWRDEALVAFQKAVDEGLASGGPEPFDFRAFKARMRARHKVD